MAQPFFEPFNKDTAIKRVAAPNEEKLTKMSDAGRIDVLTVLDRLAFEKVLKGLNIANDPWAPHKGPV